MDDQCHTHLFSLAHPTSEVITDLKHTLNEMAYEVELEDCDSLTAIVKKHLDKIQQYTKGMQQGRGLGAGWAHIHMGWMGDSSFALEMH